MSSGVYHKREMMVHTNHLIALAIELGGHAYEIIILQHHARACILSEDSKDLLECLITCAVAPPGLRQRQAEACSRLDRRYKVQALRSVWWYKNQNVERRVP